MNALTAFLALVATSLTALLVAELRPDLATQDADIPSGELSAVAPPAPPQAFDPDPATLANTVLARPLFSQTRRPPNSPGIVASSPSASAPLPRMTAILIDGPRRHAIFASQNGPRTIVAEGGHIGPFTIQTIEPQRVIVTGPDGKRVVRTSFDPALQPSLPPPPPGLGIPQFPGIAPGVAPGSPQPAGAAR